MTSAEKPYPRIRSLAMALAMLGSGAVVWLALTTVVSLYPGTGAVKASPPEKPAVGYAEQCRRVGPVSSYGFGYWSVCDARVEVSDGRVVHVVVGKSVLTSNDIGHSVDLREACFGENNTKCVYGRRVNWLWGFAVTILRIVQFAVSLAFGFLTVMYLLAATMGDFRLRRVLRGLRQRTPG